MADRPGIMTGLVSDLLYFSTGEFFKKNGDIQNQYFYICGWKKPHYISPGYVNHLNVYVLLNKPITINYME